jgi:hypothetical protein
MMLTVSCELIWLKARMGNFYINEMEYFGNLLLPVQGGETIIRKLALELKKWMQDEFKKFAYK